MKHLLKIISLFLFLASVLSGCSLLQISTQSQGALQVQANQTFSVFLNETHLGQTPYFDERIKTGTYLLKLVPVSGDESKSWQTTIDIAKRTLTVVTYESAIHPEEASSEILMLEPLNDKSETQLTISTLPDNVVVKLNGEVEGFSPISFPGIPAGDHVLTLESTGYKTKELQIKTTEGHHLVVQADLARNVLLGIEQITQITESTMSAQPATASAQPDPEEQDTESSGSDTFGTSIDGVTRGYVESDQISAPYVEILQATEGINWLRVRAQASGLTDNEVARVRVGDYFPFVETSENEEWVLIEYAPNETGWISSRYTRLTQE